MSIDKFMSIFCEESLYFPNIYSFDDRYEGRLSEKSLEEIYKTNLLNEENTPIQKDEAFYERMDFIEKVIKFDQNELVEELINLRDSL